LKLAIRQFPFDLLIDMKDLSASVPEKQAFIHLPVD